MKQNETRYFRPDSPWRDIGRVTDAAAIDLWVVLLSLGLAAVGALLALDAIADLVNR